MPIIFDYENTSLINKKELDALVEQLKPEIAKVAQAAFMNLPHDHTMHDYIMSVVEAKKALKPTLLLVIGIGGSNLGTLAVHEALHGIYYNQKNPALKFYCADTIDTQRARDLLFLVEQELKQNNSIIIALITKSGTTTETLINASLFVNLLKKYKPQNYAEYLVIITDQNSPLWHVGKQEQCAVLEIPTAVGGRYSVLSAVGLFPLGLLGVDIKKLCSGAREARSDNAAISAALLFAHYSTGKNIHDTFLFGPDLGALGAWYRQLMGESLGKLHAGITPTVSLGTVDLHSVAQLYLGGPLDKFTTFVTQTPPQELIIPATIFADLKPVGAGKSIGSLQKAIFNGVWAAYYKEHRPFVTFDLGVITPEVLGQFLYTKMLEIVFLAHLMKVNPFDQPQVELYKKEAQKFLL